MSGFHPFDLTAAVDLRDDPFPTDVEGWTGALHLGGSGTHFGYVHSGPTTLTGEVGTFVLQTGMYFSSPGRTDLQGGRGLTVTRLGYSGFFQIGGPVESVGRLRYIDGCTDSLLIPPVLLGDPCLNLLHIPPNTRQTAHTHPSLRVGLIVRGSGECVTPEGRSPLHPGLAFVIPAGARHSFHTAAYDLLVIAYHPDSDFGPTHECHPMVNRTVIGPPITDAYED